MNVAKGADYTDFFSDFKSFVRFSNKKSRYQHIGFSFIFKLTATENDTTFA